MQTYISHHRQKNKSAFRIKLYLIIFIAIFLIIGIIYAVVYSPIFRIKSIKIENAKTLTEQTILSYLQPLVLDSKISAVLGIHNLLAWPSHKITISGTPLGEAEIQKQWLSRTLIIKVKEREKFAIWCVSTEIKCYWIDKTGTIFDQAPSAEGGIIPTIFEPDNNDLIIGAKIIEEKFVNNLINILANLPRMGFSLKTLSFNRETQELKAQTYDGPDIFFSIRFDPSLNMGALGNYIQKTGVKSLEYLDLRIENKIYVKKR